MEDNTLNNLKNDFIQKLNDDSSFLDLFDYNMYKKHWEINGSYVIKDKFLLILQPCISCKCIVSENNREYCDKFLSIKCLECGELSNMIQSIGYRCECYAKDFNQNFEKRLLCDINLDFCCNYSDPDYIYNYFSLEYLKKYNLQNEYKKGDCNLSYFFACLNCKDIIIKAEHILFELGEKVCCPECQKEFYFFKYSEIGPYKLPDVFYKLNTYSPSKYPEITDRSECFLCKEKFKKYHSGFNVEIDGIHANICGRCYDIRYD